jgi:hypothetical protein
VCVYKVAVNYYYYYDGNPFIFSCKIIVMELTKQELRKKVKEARCNKRMKEAYSLKDKPPSEKLKMMFELCEFTQKLRRFANEEI